MFKMIKYDINSIEFEIDVSQIKTKNLRYKIE